MGNKTLPALLICSVFALNGMAQDRLTPRKMEMPAPQSLMDGPRGTGDGLRPPTPPMVKAAANWNKNYFGQSANAYGLLLSESRVLTYEPDLDLLAFTNRWNQPSPDDPGHLLTWYSLDQGCTWDSLEIGYGTTTLRNRYPSGVIYNPPGNTDPMMSYMVFAGPIADPGGWVGNYFGSVKLDGSNSTYQTYMNGGAGVTYQNMARVSMQATDDGRVRILGSNFDWNNSTTADWRGVVVNTGTFDNSSSSFNWTTQTINHSIGKSPVSGDQYLWSFNGGMAFSEEGDVGYVVMVGADSSNMTGIFPIVYKSIDSGATWNKMPYYDFATVSGITAQFDPAGTTPSGRLLPFFHPVNGMGLTVDKDKNLHIVTTILHAVTDHPDSLTFAYQFPDKIFDVYTTSTGWGAFYIDSMKTEPVTAATDLTWGVGWDGRIQVTRSEDGSLLYYSWLDTDPTFSSSNLYPDIYQRTRNLTTGTFTPVQNITLGSQFDADNFWMYAADKLMTDSVLGWEVPRTTSFGSGTGDMPFNHSYFGYMDCAGTGISVGETVNSGFSLSQNYPNPFSGETQFILKSEMSGMANFTLTNLLGQNIREWSMNVVPGTHQIMVNQDALSSGYYLFTMQLNGNKVSRKIMVR